MEAKKLCSLSVSAPGKVILHGEHSVVYGKTAIAASLGLRSQIDLIEHNRVSEKPTLKLTFPLVSLECEFDLLSLKRHVFNIPGLNGTIMKISTPESIDHLKFIEQIDNFLKTYEYFECIKENQKNALRTFIYIYSAFVSLSDVEVHSIEVYTDSDLTIGAGTGSSASYSVCMAGALLKYVQQKRRTFSGESGELSTGLFSPEQQSLVSAWAFNCERIMHGNPSGVDNAVCTFGSYVQFKKSDKPILLNIPLNIRILLVDTKVERETKNLVAKAASVHSRNQVAFNHIMDACDSISKQAVEIMTVISKCDDSESAKISLTTGFSHLKELWVMNHCLLSSIGVSHPRLDLVCSLANNYDLACKLTGAGGGGYAIILVPPNVDESTIESLGKCLEAHDFSVKETKLAGDGIRLDKCIFV